MLLDPNESILRMAESEIVSVREPHANTGSMDASAKAAIVTMTWAQNASEARQLLTSIRRLSKIGLPIFIGEGGSDPCFVREIRQLPTVRVCAPTGGKRTLVNQVRSAFGQAAEEGPSWIVYTEPDKRAFFRSGLQKLLKHADELDQRAASLVLAARTPRAFATFPEGQRIAEGFMNRLCGEALGLPGDYTYGPMLIHRRLLPYMHLVPEDLGWGWRFFMLAVARQLRVPIELQTVQGQCPASQRHEDSADARAYRLRQLIENVTGLANGWTCLLDQPLEMVRSLA